MNYINYFIKCCIRNFTRLLFKPKFFFTILIILVLSFFLFKIDSHATFTGDDTYTDANNILFLQYDSIVNDFIVRFLNGSQSEISKQVILSRLKSGEYSVYIYYGSQDGLSMINAQPYNTSNMYVALFDKNSINLTPSIYENYCGLTTPISEMTFTGAIYKNVDGTSFSNLGNGTYSVTIPSQLIGYTAESLKNMVTNSSQSETAEITGTIEDESEKIQNSIASSTQTVTNTLTDSTVSEESMTVNTEGLSAEDEQDIDGFFTRFLERIHNVFININDTVETIEIGLPFVNKSIILSSDMISKHIQGTTLYTLIQAVWWFVIGGYIIIFCKRMLDWLSTGKIAEKGVFSFIEWLDVNNEIIKSYMM